MSTLRYIFLLVFSGLSQQIFAQNTAPTVEMADTMRSEGKIYVVVAVVVVILAGVLAYLFVLDRKVTKLEKELREPGSRK